MKLYYMKQKALDSLQKDIADNLDKYQSASLWIDEIRRLLLGRKAMKAD